MRRLMLFLSAVVLVMSSLACGSISLPQPTIEIPDVDIPTLEVGEMQTHRETIPLPAGTVSVTVSIAFGGGELVLGAGDPAELLSGRFRYNVEEWAPEIAYRGNELTIEQGGLDFHEWGVPSGITHNEWKLNFSPNVPLKMGLKIGAGNGELDFTGLQVSALDMDMGAGDFNVFFDSPNGTAMENFTLRSGAAKMTVSGIRNAGPRNVTVQGGVGDLDLDLTGSWPVSSEVRLIAGLGAITLRLPHDIGVVVETDGGTASLETEGLRETEEGYVNDVYGTTEKELHVRITTGVGSLRLLVVE